MVLVMVGEKNGPAVPGGTIGVEPTIGVKTLMGVMDRLSAL